MMWCRMYFYFLLYYSACSGFLESQIPSKPLPGAYAPSQTTLLHLKKLNITKSPTLTYEQVFRCKTFILTSLWTHTAGDKN